MSLPLSNLCRALEALAPLSLAEDWDNVGLLIDPREAGAELDVERVLLTIDTTESVLKEAIAHAVDCLIAYHPPLFRARNRLFASVDTAVFQAILGNFAVYSPHTALDNAEGGVNDWLAEAFGPAEVTRLEPPSDRRIGPGRRIELARARSLSALVDDVKRHLGLSRVRVAESELHRSGASLRRIAVCAGSGGAVFEPMRDVDLFVTGEMRHHDVLAKLSVGSSVVLCEHTNTERGYLSRFRERLAAATGGAIEILIAESDREPLSIA